MKNKKQAFTLAELLVVVIVLGVLAAVAVPKFARVLETRKTTQAEQILSAVRMEQEQRCAQGKNYLPESKKNQINTLADASSGGHYTYSLSASGAQAASEKGYAIKMLSYKQGQICCEGAYCASLNKAYADCASLTQPEDECAADVSAPQPEEQTCAQNPAQEKCCDPNTQKWDGAACMTKTACEMDGQSCACETYAQENPGECDPNSCEANPAQEKCCDSTTQQWDGSSCVYTDPCADPKTQNTCECSTYKYKHQCECYQDASHCCSDYDYDAGMEYDPDEDSCSCPAGSVLKDYGSSGYCECLDTGTAAKASSYCCVEQGYTWKDGRCQERCRAYTYEEPAFVSYSSGKIYSGFYSMGGNSPCADYPASSGAGQKWSSLVAENKYICETTDTDSYYSGGLNPKSAGLTCETQVNENRYVGSFSCAYRFNYHTYSSVDCVMGVMTCTAKASEPWYCPVFRCGEEINECR